MSEKDQYKNRIELLQGTLDMLILQTLQWGPQHGYGIVQALRLRSGDVLQVETGSLYPALHRGCSLSGSSQTASKKPDITESRPRGKSSWPRIWADGSGLSKRLGR
jgi:hypothetical protein